MAPYTLQLCNCISNCLVSTRRRELIITEQTIGVSRSFEVYNSMKQKARRRGDGVA